MVEYLETIEKRFKHLEAEMKQHYFWCKVKMNLYGVVLLGLLLVFK